MPKLPQERQKSYRERIADRGIVTISHRVPVATQRALTALAESAGVGVAEYLGAIIREAEAHLLASTNAEDIQRRDRYWAARDQLSR